MNLEQKYGPLLDYVPELKEYILFSEKAFIMSNRLGGNSSADWGSNEARVLSLLMYYGLNTSYSIRLLTTFAQPIEAFALLRIRFEQLIVTSYLIHSDFKDGFEPFISDISKSDYRFVKSIENIDPTIYGIIEKVFENEIEAAKLKTFFHEQQIDPEFDFDKDILKSKWCKLNKYDMCKKRDELIPEDDPLKIIKLSHIYLSIYKTASIFIHSETGILTENFLSNYKGQPSPNISIVLSNLINLAQIDLLQTYEVLKFIKPENSKPLLDLYYSYNDMILKDYDVIIDKIKNAL